MTGRPHQRAYRRDLTWLAAMTHRISGIALACFLPAHFLVLGLAIRGEAELDRFLTWTHDPLVKLAEAGLLVLLGLHLLGGLRLLAIEVGGWYIGRTRAVLTGAAGLACLLGAVFLTIAA